MFAKEQNRVSEMAQQVKAFATKPAGPSLISGLHVDEGEHQLLQLVLWPPPVRHIAYVHTCTHSKYIHIIKRE